MRNFTRNFMRNFTRTFMRNFTRNFICDVKRQFQRASSSTPLPARHFQQLRAA